MTELAFTSAYANDTGDKSSGTIVNKAFFESIEDAINALIHSATNAAVTPADIIDEVVAARGSLGALDTRLDVSLNEDGTLKEQADLVTAVQAQRLTAAIDLAYNGRLDRWTNGDSSDPDEFTLSGTGAAIVKTGPGESDTEDLDTNHWAAKITYGSAPALLTQTVIASGDFAEHHDLRTRKVSAVVRCKSSASSQARLVIDDGVNQSASDFHAGDGALEKLTVTHTMAATASKLDVYMEVAVSGAAYFTKLSVAFTDIGLEDWVPFGGEAAEDHPGLITDRAQIIAGAKTWRGAQTLDAGFASPPLGVPTYSRCDTTLTKNANTTLENVSGLAFAVGANEVWVFRFVMFGTSNAAADFKFALTGPASPTSIQYAYDQAAGSAAYGDAFGDSFPVASTGAEGLINPIEGILRNGANAGTVQLQFAQNSSHASNSQVYEGSYVIAWRIS